MLLQYSHYEQSQRAINPLLHNVFRAFGTSFTGINIIPWDGKAESQGQIHFLAISILNIDSAQLEKKLPPELKLLRSNTEAKNKQEHYLCFTGNTDYPSENIIQTQQAIRLET